MRFCLSGKRENEAILLDFPFAFLLLPRIKPDHSIFCQDSYFYFIYFLILMILFTIVQADVETDVAPGVPKKRTFKKFSFRGVDLDALLDMSTDDLVKLLQARARRR